MSSISSYFRLNLCNVAIQQHQSKKEQNEVCNHRDVFDKEVTLCDGRSMSLSEYRRQIEESCIKYQLQKQQSGNCLQTNKPEEKHQKMLIVYPNGKQRLITFNPKKGTVQNVLNVIGIPDAVKTTIKRITIPSSYDYIITMENIVQHQNQNSSCGLTMACNVSTTRAGSKRKFVELRNEVPSSFAVCSRCRTRIVDHHRCERCGAVFDDNAKITQSAK